MGFLDIARVEPGAVADAITDTTGPAPDAIDALVGTRINTNGSDTRTALDARYAQHDDVPEFDTAGTLATGDATITVGGVRKQPGMNARYSAFPSMTRLPDGRLFLVWYEATNHVDARDGEIKGSFSTDNGVTWAAATTVYKSAGEDLRDPTVALSDDKQTLYLTYFKGSVSNAAAGFFVRQGTPDATWFDTEIRIDPHPYAAGCSPLVTLANGQLLATWYGKADLADARDSVWVALSPNKGTTWGAPVKIVDGVAASLDMQEPYATVSGSTVVITYRHGNAGSVGVVKSADNGATWGAGVAKFPGSGRPTTLLTSSGTLLCIYRQVPGTSAQQHGIMRASKDLGATWTGPRLVEAAGPAFWVYSSLLETTRGQILAASTVETSTTTTELSLRYITEGGGISPYGDVATGQVQRVLNRASTIAAADDFDRPNAAFLDGARTVDGRRWYTDGSANITDSTLQDTAANGPHAHYIKALCTSHEVQAEMLWSVTAGVALICRVQDANNYLMATIETSGTNARIYKVVAGTATQLATATVSCPADVWHRFRFTAVGNNLRFYIEEALAATVSDATFNTQGGAGVRTGAAIAGTVHRVRNFSVIRRSEINT